jgi:hypothetical protein
MPDGERVHRIGRASHSAGRLFVNTGTRSTAGRPVGERAHATSHNVILKARTTLHLRT